MAVLARATDVIGLPVVTAVDGEDVAEVRDVVVDARAHRIRGFTLNKRGFFAGRLPDVLPAEGVVSVGRDAVVVADADALTEPGDRGPVEGGFDLFGLEVVTAGGRRLGTVSAVILVLGRDPRVVGYELAPPDVSTHLYAPAHAELALSEDALLLPDEAVRFLREDLVGFGAVLGEFLPLLPPSERPRAEPARPPGGPGAAAGIGAPPGTDAGDAIASEIPEERIVDLGQVLGLPILSADDASALGEVGAVVVDREGRRIECLAVAGSGRPALIVPWAAVRSLGIDAVIVETASSLRPGDDHATESVRHPERVLGGRVLGLDGFERGEVIELLLDRASGEVLSIMTAGETFRPDAIRSLGSYAWIVEPAGDREPPTGPG